MSRKMFLQKKRRLQKQVQVHYRNLVPSNKFSVFHFAKENIANSAWNVRKVYFILRQSTENSKIKRFLFCDYYCGIDDSCKKLEINMTYAEENGAEDEGRQQAEYLKRYAFRHASVCTAYVHRRKCSRWEGSRQKHKKKRKRRRRRREMRRASTSSSVRETLAAWRPFSRGVVADWRRCGPITRCDKKPRIHGAGWVTKGRFYSGWKISRRCGRSFPS